MKKIYQIIMLCAMSIAIASCGNSTPSGNESEGDYRTAVQNGDFEEAHKILETISDFDKYIEAMKYIYINEIQTISLNDDDAEDKIVYLLSGIPTHGVRPSNYDHIGCCSDGEEEMSYLKFVQTYNELCNTALTLALNRKNKKFAQNVIGLYKKELEIDRYPKPGFVGYEYHNRARFSEKSINDAKKKYNDAIDLGLFGDETQKYEIE